MVFPCSLSVSLDNLWMNSIEFSATLTGLFNANNNCRHELVNRRYFGLSGKEVMPKIKFCYLICVKQISVGFFPGIQ